MDVQLTELAAEGEMLLRRDVLVTEEDDAIFGQRAMAICESSRGPWRAPSPSARAVWPAAELSVEAQLEYLRG